MSLNVSLMKTLEDIDVNFPEIIIILTTVRGLRCTFFTRVISILYYITCCYTSNNYYCTKLKAAYERRSFNAKTLILCEKLFKISREFDGWYLKCIICSADFVYCNTFSNLVMMYINSIQSCDVTPAILRIRKLLWVL